MKRIEIKEPIKFFDDILQNGSLRSFGKQIGINYSTLKQWRRGDLLIPEEIFYRLLKYSINKVYWLNQINIKQKNWGCSKGGKITISKLSKEELNKKLDKARKNIKKHSIGKVVNVNINESFCEFYGALMGDGCISKFKTKENKIKTIMVISGHKHLDKDYHENYLKNLIKKEWDINAGIYFDKKANWRRLTIFNKSFSEHIIRLEFPIGKKGQRLVIPDYLFNLPWTLKKYIVRGIFDTDGSISARKDENYKYPHIIITSYSKKLIKQLYNMLKENGYPFWITKDETEIRMRGIKNINKWMKDIGTSNIRHKFKYEYFLRCGRVPPRMGP